MCEIIYPCMWDYLIIILKKDYINEDSILKNIDLKYRKYEILHSKNSKNNSYISLKLSLYVNDKNDRDNIFQQLNKINGVKIVI